MPFTASSRQKIREVLPVHSFPLDPVTIFSVSPIVIVIGAEDGIVKGSFVLFSHLSLLSFAVGRLWFG
jgi:hypothetical protein